MSLQKIVENKLSMPVFGAKRMGTHLILSGGGGGKQFGLPNSIKSLKMADLETVNDFDTEDKIFSGVLPITGTDTFFSWSEKTVGVFQLGNKGDITLRKEVNLKNLLSQENNNSNQENQDSGSNETKNESEKKFESEENLEWALCEIYSSKFPPTKQLGPNIRKELRDRRISRSFLGITENGVLIQLDDSLKSTFQLDLNEPILSLTWANNLNLAVIIKKNGSILFFDPVKQKFVKKLDTKNPESDSSGYSTQLLKANSKIKKAIVLSYPRVLARTATESDPNLSKALLIFLTLMNKKTFCVLLKDPLDPNQGSSWVDLGNLRVSTAKFMGTLGIIVTATGSGDLNIYETGPGVQGVLRPIKTITAHNMPVPVLLAVNLHSKFSEDIIDNLLCSYKLPKSNESQNDKASLKNKQANSKNSENKNSDYLDALIENLNFKNLKPKIGIWTFGLDYDCKMWGGDINAMKQKSLFNMWTMAVIFFLLSFFFYFFML